VACFVIQSQIDDDSTVLSFLIWGQCCGPPVSSSNKNDRHNITEILLKVALNTIKKTNKQTDTTPLHTYFLSNIQVYFKMVFDI
jgi:hypothetical protein